MAKPHDALAHRSLSRPEVAGGYLRSVLPPVLLERLDLSDLTLESAKFVDPDLRERQADFLYQVRLDGRQAYLYVLLEHQTSVDPFMALRLLDYCCQALDHWRGEHPEARSLPPIVPLVLYAGRHAWTAPLSLGQLFDLASDTPEEVRSLLPELRYRVDDLARHKDEELARRPMPPFGRVALLFLRHASDTEPAFLEFVGWAELKALVNGLENGDDVATITRYIVEAAPGEPGSVLQTFAAHLEPSLQEVTMNIAEQLRQEGMQQGMQQGRLETLLEQITHKFAPNSSELSATKKRLEGATPDQLRAWSLRCLSADSLEALFGSVE